MANFALTTNTAALAKLQSAANAAQTRAASAQQSAAAARDRMSGAQAAVGQATSVLGQATAARDTALGARDKSAGIAQEANATAVGWSSAAAGALNATRQRAADIEAQRAASQYKMQGEVAHDARVAAGEEDNKLGKGRSLLGAASAATGAGLAMIKQPNLTFSGRRA
jgi:hypothetical protein